VQNSWPSYARRATTRRVPTCACAALLLSDDGLAPVWQTLRRIGLHDKRVRRASPAVMPIRSRAQPIVGVLVEYRNLSAIESAR
jgi:hypothetical protein